ncbi:hypothetical protein ACFL1H_02675 [Nanoarchaeota archaeon]
MKALLLLSTGIDSPVAGKLMKNKGLELIGVHFVTSKKDKKNIVIKQCELLGIKKLFVVNYFDVQKEFVDKINRRQTCIFCKRFMLKIGEKIALQEGCKYLVTGENMGQVASQTLDNMVVLDDAVDLVVLRPLLTKDKNDTIKIANEIGSFETSSEDKDGCWAVPRCPVTKVKLEKVKLEEKKIDVDGIIDNAVKNVEIIEL